MENGLEEGEITDEPETEKKKLFRFFTRHAVIKDNQNATVTFSKVIMVKLINKHQIIPINRFYKHKFDNPPDIIFCLHMYI